jgi:hypothetical protein
VEGHDDDPLSALAHAYTAFNKLRENAAHVLATEQKQLQAQYRAAIIPGRGTGSSNLPLEEVDDDTRALLIDAEPVIVHGLSVSVTVSRTSEREIRDYEHAIRTQRRRFDQLLRMRERGPLRQRPQPAAPQSLEPALVNGGDVTCALCARDFWSPPGSRELALAPADPSDPEVVCWICGDEHAPDLTAMILAEAVLDVEHRVGGTANYRDHWVALLRRMGMEQRAIDLEEDLDDAKATIREMKAAALSTAETWFEPPNGSESAER